MEEYKKKIITKNVHSDKVDLDNEDFIHIKSFKVSEEQKLRKENDRLTRENKSLKETIVSLEKEEVDLKRKIQIQEDNLKRLLEASRQEVAKKMEEIDLIKGVCKSVNSMQDLPEEEDKMEELLKKIESSSPRLIMTVQPVKSFKKKVMELPNSNEVRVVKSKKVEGLQFEKDSILFVKSDDTESFKKAKDITIKLTAKSDTVKTINVTSVSQNIDSNIGSCKDSSKGSEQLAKSEISNTSMFKIRSALSSLVMSKDCITTGDYKMNISDSQRLYMFVTSSGFSEKDCAKKRIKSSSSRLKKPKENVFQTTSVSVKRKNNDAPCELMQKLAKKSKKAVL